MSSTSTVPTADDPRPAPRSRAHSKTEEERLRRRQETLARYQARNPGRFRKWRLANPEKQNERERRYKARHPDRIKAAHKRRDEQRRRDPGLSLHSRVSRGVRASIRKGTKRGRSWEILLGYTTAELLAHIERQFAPGMSWAKYLAGEIHLDHIRPVSSFSFSFSSPSDPEFKACWALSNLRPLWASENQKKHAKILVLL